VEAIKSQTWAACGCSS